MPVRSSDLDRFNDFGVRPAIGAEDLRRVRHLDETVFPVGSVDLKRADPGELELGVALGDVFLLERGAEPVGFLHADRRNSNWTYLAGLAIRPDLQGHGLGRLLIRDLITSAAQRGIADVLITATSPRNHAMLKLLFSCDFAARWPLPDFFGPGQHRLGCQLRRRSVPRPAGAGVFVPMSALDVLFRAMSQNELVVRTIETAHSEAQFVLSSTAPDEFLGSTSWPIESITW